MVTPEMAEAAEGLLRAISTFISHDQWMDEEGDMHPGKLDLQPEIRKSMAKRVAAKIEEMIRLYVKIQDSRLVSSGGSPTMGHSLDDKGPVGSGT